MGMLSTVAVALFSVSATADDHYKFYQSAAPIICGDTKTVMEYGAEQGWTPFSVSFGKVGGKEGVKLEQQYLVGENGLELMSHHPLEDI